MKHHFRALYAHQEWADRGVPERRRARFERGRRPLRLVTGPRSVVLAGSTVAFDQSFLRVHMPGLAELLSHRCFDVSTLKMADRAWADQPFKKAEAHRAMPDILESLKHAKEIRARRWPGVQ